MSFAFDNDASQKGHAAGASLTLRGVRKSFGAKAVLTGVDLHVPAGQFLAIVGRSGCGKSTLLRLMAGLDEPTGGTIEVAGASRERARLARIMFQEPRLLPWARVDANVAIGLGPSADQTRAVSRSRDALAMVGLLDRAGEWPSVLSGGQKQRVALAYDSPKAPGLYCFYFCQARLCTASRRRRPGPQGQSPAHLTAKYVGSRACQSCHADIYARWQKTPMANVVRDPREHPEVIIPDLATNNVKKFTVDDVGLV